MRFAVWHYAVHALMTIRFSLPVYLYCILLQIIPHQAEVSYFPQFALLLKVTNIIFKYCSYMKVFR